MRKHLSDEQLTEALLHTASAEVSEHLARCAACAEEQQRLQKAFAGLSAATRATAERPEGFWYTQRAAIATRLGESVPQRSRLLAWAGALAALVLLAALMMPQGAPVQSPSERAQMNPTRNADPDHELMVGIEQSMRRQVPRALEPALLLTQEMNQAVESRPNP